MPSIPVFVINLDRRDDRLQAMQKRLSRIRFIRFPAVDGATRVPRRDDLHRPGFLYPMSANELACIQSHLNICQRIVEEGLPYACVLEDDVILSGEFGEFVKNDTWIPAGADLIKVETMRQRVWLSRKAKRAAGRNLHKLCSFHPGTAGYIISLAGADKMQGILRDPDQAADDLMFKRAVETGEFGDIWQMVPALCVQEFRLSGSFPESDILAERDDLRAVLRKKPKGVAKLIRELQRPFLQAWEKSRRFTQKRGIVGFE